MCCVVATCVTPVHYGVIIIVIVQPNSVPNKIQLMFGAWGRSMIFRTTVATPPNTWIPVLPVTVCPNIRETKAWYTGSISGRATFEGTLNGPTRIVFISINYSVI